MPYYKMNTLLLGPFDYQRGLRRVILHFVQNDRGWPGSFAPKLAACASALLAGQGARINTARLASVYNAVSKSGGVPCQRTNKSGGITARETSRAIMRLMQTLKSRCLSRCAARRM